MHKEKKNLLIICNSYPYLSNYGGMFVKEQVNYIKYKFDQIIIISPRMYYPKILLKSRKFRLYLRNEFQPIDYTYENVKVFYPRYIPLPVFINSLMDIILYFQTKTINKLLKKEKIKFDIIHSHFIIPSGYIGTKLKEKHDVPLIITGHGGDVYFQPFINKRFFNRTRNILAKADSIIATSSRNKKILIDKIGVSQDKIDIITNGFDNNLFIYETEKTAKLKIYTDLGIQKDRMLILTIGNLIDIKGHKYLIEAIKELVSVRNDIFCVIIGKGSKKEELENQIKNLNLIDFVKIIDGVPHEEISTWMNACDLFVLSSLDEGNPTVMFECLGSGKPFIGTRVGGITEIIISDEYGLLCEPANSKELFEKILLGLNKKWDNIQIKNYAEQFSWHNISLDLMKIYEESFQK